MTDQWTATAGEARSASWISWLGGGWTRCYTD